MRSSCAIWWRSLSREFTKVAGRRDRVEEWGLRWRHVLSPPSVIRRSIDTIATDDPESGSFAVGPFRPCGAIWLISGSAPGQQLTCLRRISEAGRVATFSVTSHEYAMNMGPGGDRKPGTAFIRPLFSARSRIPAIPSHLMPSILPDTNLADPNLTDKKPDRQEPGPATDARQRHGRNCGNRWGLVCPPSVPSPPCSACWRWS